MTDTETIDLRTGRDPSTLTPVVAFRVTQGRQPTAAEQIVMDAVERQYRDECLHRARYPKRIGDS